MLQLLHDEKTTVFSWHCFAEFSGTRITSLFHLLQYYMSSLSQQSPDDEWCALMEPVLVIRDYCLRKVLSRSFSNILFSSNVRNQWISASHVKVQNRVIKSHQTRLASFIQRLASHSVFYIVATSNSSYWAFIMTQSILNVRSRYGLQKMTLFRFHSFLLRTWRNVAY